MTTSLKKLASALAALALAVPAPAAAQLAAAPTPLGGLRLAAPAGIAPALRAEIAALPSFDSRPLVDLESLQLRGLGATAEQRTARQAVLALVLERDAVALNRRTLVQGLGLRAVETLENASRNLHAATAERVSVRRALGRVRAELIEGVQGATPENAVRLASLFDASGRMLPVVSGGRAYHLSRPGLRAEEDRPVVETSAVEVLGAQGQGRAAAILRGQLEAAEYERIREELAKKAEQGQVESLPVMGDGVTGLLLNYIANRPPKLVLLDYDDTLAPWAKPLGVAVESLIGGLLKAGVSVGILTDRRDTKSSSSPSILDSLEGAAPENKTGLYVGGNKGARVLRYDDKGQAALVAEEPGLSAEEKAALQETMAELQASGEYDRADLTDYAGALIYKAEKLSLTPEAQLAMAREAAARWDAALRARGFEFEVLGRTAKDPLKNPPYLAASKLTKAVGVRNLEKLSGVTAPEEILVVGDSFFEPNVTDLDMAKAAKGAVAISVGGTMDPRVPRGFVFPARGAEGSAAVLQAVLMGHTVVKPMRQMHEQIHVAQVKSLVKMARGGAIRMGVVAAISWLAAYLWWGHVLGWLGAGLGVLTTLGALFFARGAYQAWDHLRKAHPEALKKK